VNSSSKLPEIRKEAFKRARESAGLSTQDLALKACLSNRQIEQLENGEMSSFYGAQIKYTAAKKVAALLGLSEQEAFDFGSRPKAIEQVVMVEETPPVETKNTKPDKPNNPKHVVVDKKEPETSQVSVASSQSMTDKALELQDIAVEKAVVQENANPSSQRKWLLLLSVIAAIVFSVVNLRPLFFPEAPKELVLEVPAVPAEPAPASSVPAPEEKANAAVPVLPPVASTVPPSNECPAMDSAPMTYKPETPKKAADMVYMQAKSAQMVCVIDALGKVQNKQLEPGVGVSVYGRAPLKVLTSGLDQVDLYFQGAKVRPASLSGKTIILEATELPQALAPTDSGLR
jgi:transcriptional regulator with XRE-family HTH domain